MMARTDRHDRYFLRLISRHVLLYTEMITAEAILHGDPERLLGHDPLERPLALQVAGADPGALARCAGVAEAMGFDEINLNLGCPSERVLKGRFGACLMAEPKLVAESVAAMRAATAIPVTVKTRTGIDGRDSYPDLRAFVATVAEAGCRTFIVHARKAWLKGLNPKQNRNLPALEYDKVFRLKRDFPEAEIILNGGIESIADAKAHLRRLDGVMIGRAAYDNPYLLAQADRTIFSADQPPKSRQAIVAEFLPYARAQHARGVPMRRMTRHIAGLFRGRPGSRAWRRSLGEYGPDAGPEVISHALNLVAGRTEFT